MALDVKGGANGILSGATTGASIGSIIPGLGTTLGGVIGGGLGLIGGLFKGDGEFKEKQKLMQQAWEYEKEGMGLQYNYGQQAADAEYKRNLQMWKDTNFGAQRAEMEKAGLSVGLMYGNGGGQAASTAGGDGMQPSGPKMNPVEAALQQQAMGLQLKQIEAQNRLASAETAKTLAEANKIAGVDTEGTKLDNEWKKVENRIQLSRENIEASNVTAAEANAQKAVAEWNSAVIQAEIDADTKVERTQMIIEQLANMRKQGALMVANRELSEKQKEKVEKEINYMFYELYTKRMSAEAAKDLAKATYEKVKNEYELGKEHLSLEEEKNLREWIYGGIHEGAEIIKIITDFLPAGKATKVLKTIKEYWDNNGNQSTTVTRQMTE
jgi:hypothetical protein